jgi:integrase
MLTVTQIRNAKPRQTPYKLSDERALYLLITPAGGRLWRFKYRVGPKQAKREKLLALGSYPDVSLALARDRRDDARKLLAKGIDPATVKAEREAAEAHTFGAVAEEWLRTQAKKLTPVTLAKARWMLDDYLLPAFKDRPLTTITAPDVLRELRKLEGKGAHDTAHRVRQRASQVFRYAIAAGIGGCERDPTQDLRGALAPVVTKHHAAVTEPRAVGALLRAIDGYSGQPAVGYALKLAPHLFVRPGELRAAEWSEFDLKAKQWRIPAARTKLRREHLVPLSTQAVTLLEELQAHTGRFRFVFPALSKTDRCISENTLNAALRRMGYDTKTEMTAHGFRSLASTLLNERGTAPDLIELQLAHKERDKVRGAYNRAERLKERTKLMQDWSNYLDELRKLQPAEGMKEAA